MEFEIFHFLNFLPHLIFGYVLVVETPVGILFIKSNIHKLGENHTSLLYYSFSFTA